MVVIPVLAIGLWPLGYLTAVSRWFDRRLGLALGCANAGIGVGSTLVPLVIAALILNDLLPALMVVLAVASVITVQVWRIVPLAAVIIMAGLAESDVMAWGEAFFEARTQEVEDLEQHLEVVVLFVADDVHQLQLPKHRRNQLIRLT